MGMERKKAAPTETVSAGDGEGDRLAISVGQRRANRCAKRL